MLVAYVLLEYFRWCSAAGTGVVAGRPGFPGSPGETDRIAGRLIADPVRASVHAERLRQGGEPMDMASDLVSN
ncbi:hypothetical protein [Bifidobacterium longum]|uniref:hypothetical protein n=1 Tax=Bifidobacterium longum TaxID=216816 RepID=UPI0012D34730|nr:hypothetical protein [Bifidobacterium longum]